MTIRERVGKVRALDPMLGRRIASRRVLLGIKQGGLAEMVGVSRKTMNHIECGRQAPTVACLNAVAATLGVTTDWLLNGDPAEDKAA